MNLRVWDKRLWITLAVICLCVGLVPSIKVQAGLEACQVTVSPDSVAVGSTTSFSFDVTNSSSSSIQWLRITAPGGGVFTMQSGAADGWNTNVDSNSVTFIDGSLPRPFNQPFVVEALANSGTTNNSWSVQASDDPGGAAPINCSGTTTVSVTTPPISISNIRVSNVTSTSATIQWDTNTPSTSQVNYGASASYGSSTARNNALVTTHSTTLTGLSSSTGYHYQVASTTSGNSASSGDGTFLTAAAPAGSGGTSNPTPSGGSNTNTGSVATSGKVATSVGRGIAILAKPVENTPPTITISTTVPAVVSAIPTISGSADDDQALARIEYSTDGGVNWLPVDISQGLGSKHATYSFTPVGSKEDNYTILVRAIDLSGNIGLTNPQKTVLDRLPPQVGGNVLSLGPQVLDPEANGSLASLARINQKITLSATGGPTSIVLRAIPTDKLAREQSFNLTYSTDSELWSGLLSFTNPGKYSLVATAVDGAGNKTTRTLNSTYVYSPSHTIDAKSRKAVSAHITVYTLEQDTNAWVTWDGASYGQSNPQMSDTAGGFEFILPPGKYYLKATAEGYRTATTSIFSNKSSQPVTTTVRLTPLRGVHIGTIYPGLPNLGAQKISFGSGLHIPTNLGNTSVVGKPLPDFTLRDTTGQTIKAATLLGKPTVISFGATWSPTTSEQINALAKLQMNSAINAWPVAIQENSAEVRAYTDVAGLNMRWLVDPDSTLSDRYSIQSMPTHYFVDRKGIVKRVVTGVLSENELTKILTEL